MSRSFFYSKQRLGLSLRIVTVPDGCVVIETLGRHGHCHDGGDVKIRPFHQNLHKVFRVKVAIASFYHFLFSWNPSSIN